MSFSREVDWPTPACSKPAGNGSAMYQPAAGICSRVFNPWHASSSIHSIILCHFLVLSVLSCEEAIVILSHSLSPGHQETYLLSCFAVL